MADQQAAKNGGNQQQQQKGPRPNAPASVVSAPKADAPVAAKAATPPAPKAEVKAEAKAPAPAKVPEKAVSQLSKNSVPPMWMTVTFWVIVVGIIGYFVYLMQTGTPPR